MVETCGAYLKKLLILRTMKLPRGLVRIFMR